MEFDIYFCNDGVLRAKFNNKTPLFPLSFIQKHKNISDLSFWSKCWNNNVYFEKNLTFSQFFFCIEPWGNFFKEITSKDIPAFIKEARKLSLVSNNSNKTKIDWIDVSYFTEYEPSREYLKEDLNLKEDLEDFFNTPQDVRLTGRWEHLSGYKVTGYVLNEHEQYSIECTPINKLANVPLVLNENHITTFSSLFLNEFFEENPIFKDKPFGFINLQDNKNYYYLISKKYHKFRDLIEGFFLFFNNSPKDRDLFIDYLEKSISYIKEDNISHLDDKENNYSNIHFYNHLDKEEKDYLKELLNESKKQNILLKIATTNIAEPLEQRIYNNIYDINNEIIATEYKKI